MWGPDDGMCVWEVRTYCILKAWVWGLVCGGGEDLLNIEGMGVGTRVWGR